MSETTTTAKFKKGDHVTRINHPEWGMGIVWEVTPCKYGYYYKVEFTDAPTGAVREAVIDQDYLLPYTPEPKFKKGDSVIDIRNTNLGVGVIVIQISSKEYLVHFEKMGLLAQENNLIRVEKKSGGSGVPIGPVPEHRWIDNRIMELAKSIHDHIDRGHKVPRIWIEELTRHLETFNNR